MEFSLGRASPEGCAYSYKIDPKDYPFQKFIDEQKHLDTDELRHTIKPVIHVINKDFKGEEHKFCDKEQLCPLGKFRRPKILVEAEKRGFATGLEMVEADKKAEQEAKNIAGQALGKEVDELKRIVSEQNKLLEFLLAKIK
jgi:hypothetical protein